MLTDFTGQCLDVIVTTGIINKKFENLNFKF